MENKHELDPFLPEIEKFMVEFGLRKTTFGKKMLNAPQFIDSMRLGRRLRLTTRNSLSKKMDTYREIQAAIDDAVIALVISHRGVIVGLDGVATLINGSDIDGATFDRLVRRGKLIPNGDSMFDVPSQTWSAGDSQEA